MTQVSLVVAIDEQRGMGYKNRLLCHLPADLKHFKELTMGKPIIMGHQTYLSIGRPLPGRKNVVLTKQTIAMDGVELAHSVEHALDLVEHAPEIMIIGGAQVFEQTLTMATHIYLTKIHHHFKADVFFPDIDETLWTRHVIGTHPKDEKNPYAMTFFRYERRR